MIDPPELKLGDWIQVGPHKGLVGLLYPPGGPFGLGVFIYDAQKPTSHDFDWNGTEFYFPERPDFGGYADKNPMYADQVRELKALHKRNNRR